jgi:hypothetical protein
MLYPRHPPLLMEEFVMCPRPWWSSLALIPLLSAMLASAPAHASQTPAAAGHYVDTSGYLQTDAEIEAWYALTHGLKQNFDEICGDTFCEGEFGNIESLRYRCSVDEVSGRVGMCVWIFAASNEEIDPATGRISVQKGFWRCRTPLAAGTTLRQLLTALQGDSPLYARLPGSDKSVFDGLIDCL